MNYKQDIKDLTEKLNLLTKKYDEGHPEVSDLEWDEMYFKLLKMENKFHYCCKDSPTQKINYQVINELKKVKHNHKMLSLEKTKNLEDVINFSNNQILVAMTKADGLTCSLKYINGKLISAETRGDGLIGEDILHNALVLQSIPNRIAYTEELIIDGEIVCLYSDFIKFENEYKNPRNFAAGSIRLLDSKECANRKLTFVAWDIIKGFDNCNTFTHKMLNLKDLGFIIVPMVSINPEGINEDVVDCIKNFSKDIGIPIDGIVFKYENIKYGLAQGATAHHFKNAIAYKFYDETYPSHLKDIDWGMSRSGKLTPVAIFDPVEIDGSIVERASLHNVDILKELLYKPWFGQPIQVAKMNMIIPQIISADKITLPRHKDDYFIFPEECPICGSATILSQDNNTTFLICSNPQCEGKFINQLNHFCGKKGLDIKGLSLATLTKLVEWNWVNNIVDIYFLDRYQHEWILKPGFGKKSVENILQAIKESKNCTLEAFISSLGIPLIGKNVATELTHYFSTYEEFRKAINEKYNFSQIEGFADCKTSALLDFDYTQADEIAKILNISSVSNKAKTDLSLNNKKYVITGTVKNFKNRAELQSFIEERGGKVVSAISKNVDYLINNNPNSTSTKNIAAKKMGIPIITEAEFLAPLA